jgi:hypothetical protein
MAMDEVGEASTRVLAIGGWGRCGSTVLDMMLGQIDGFVSVGEVREVWLRGCVEDRPCGCGEPFSSCSFWTEVGVEAFGGWSRLDVDDILRVRYRWDRAWGLPRLLSSAGVTSGHGDLARYAATLSRLLRAVAVVAGARVVIDSSKLPTHTLLLRHAPGIDARLVHLVRDSRGVAHSVRKHVAKPVSHGSPTELPRHGAVATSVRYDVYNGAQDVLAGMERRAGRSLLRVRYEDLVADPARWLSTVARHADEEACTDLPFLDRATRCVTLAANHMVDGNPVRFSDGAVALRLDTAWHQCLHARDRRLVTLMTLPLLARYDYPVSLADAVRMTATPTAAARG